MEALGTTFDAGQGQKGDAPTGDTPPEGSNVDQKIDLTGNSDSATGEAWKTRYDGHAKLLDYARAKSDDPSAWEYDYDKMAKVMDDRLAEASRLQARVKELSDAGAENEADKPPADMAEYMSGFDHEALSKAAPQSYRQRNEDGSHVAETAFFRQMHSAGVPVGKAREMFTGMMTELNGHIPAPKSDAERLQAAVTALGVNGRQQLQDVNDWLGGLHKAQAFSEEEQSILRNVMHTAPGLGALWRMSRVGAGARPGGDTSKTSPAQAAEALSMDEIHKAMGTERYKTDSAYRESIGRSLDRLVKNGAGTPSVAMELQL